MACKKKLHAFRPTSKPETVQSFRTKATVRLERADPNGLETDVRQLLADKVSGSYVGLWLLLPEHLRLGTWDLLCGWSQKPAPCLQPRLALQLVHEAALCVTGIRQGRTLSQRGFELAQGLPFVASDQAVHDLLDAHTVQEARELQLALGRIRRARGHFGAQLLAIDPHRIASYSQRQMRRHRPSHKTENKPGKCCQTFFALDAQTQQPLGFLCASSSITVSQATPPLLELAQAILHPERTPALVLADSEHFTLEILDQIQAMPQFDLLVPMPNQPYYRKDLDKIPVEAFRHHWAGLAIAKQSLRRPQVRHPFYQLVQRLGEKPDDYEYRGFWSTADRPEAQDLIVNFPQRWHIEEFFHDHQDLGWSRAGTLNLNIRYAHMTMALLAQASLHQLRQRLGPPWCQWDAKHLAANLLSALDGDIRVRNDTILVTYYNAPNAQKLAAHYQGLPEKLAAEAINPSVPWLYNFKLDFRFK